eukprot:m.804172 g.804172  ORF g.804172 m.804172 type:complete len:76 (-) comp23368_c0_seq14:2559-2786(-)
MGMPFPVQAVQTLERDVTQREQRVADILQANEQLHQTIARMQEEVRCAMPPVTTQTKWKFAMPKELAVACSGCYP